MRSAAAAGAAARRAGGNGVPWPALRTLRHTRTLRPTVTAARSDTGTSPRRLRHFRLGMHPFTPRHLSVPSEDTRAQTATLTARTMATRDHHHGNRNHHHHHHGDRLTTSYHHGHSHHWHRHNLVHSHQHTVQKGPAPPPGPPPSYLLHHRHTCQAPPCGTYKDMGVLCDKFIPAPGDIVGQKLRSLKDKHNAREVKRKQRRLKEKADKENQKGQRWPTEGQLAHPPTHHRPHQQASERGALGTGRCSS